MLLTFVLVRAARGCRRGPVCTEIIRRTRTWADAYASALSGDLGDAARYKVRFASAVASSDKVLQLRTAGQERPGIMRVNFYATYDVRFEFGPGNDMEGRLCTVGKFRLEQIRAAATAVLHPLLTVLENAFRNTGTYPSP